MDLRLKGLRALVTGGTRGIGRAVVESLVREGVDVSFCARNAGDVSDLEETLSRGGSKVHGTALDVADHPALESWVRDSATRFGGLDIVVSNASAMANGTDPASWRACFEVDLMGCVGLVEASLPWLEASAAASVISIASVQGRELTTAVGAYGPMKAALVHYTHGLASSLAGKGIRANAVSPGNTYFEGSVWSRVEREQPERFRTALSQNPTGRMGTPQEVANVVLFLASPTSSFVTGGNILVDGALTHGVQF